MGYGDIRPPARPGDSLKWGPVYKVAGGPWFKQMRRKVEKSGRPRFISDVAGGSQGASMECQQNSNGLWAPNILATTLFAPSAKIPRYATAMYMFQ